MSDTNQIQILSRSGHELAPITPFGESLLNAADSTAAQTILDITPVSAPLTLASGTITASDPALTVTQTWNNAAVTFVAKTTNVTATASAAASLLERWQVGGTDVFVLYKDGFLRHGDGSSLLKLRGQYGDFSITQGGSGHGTTSHPLRSNQFCGAYNSGLIGFQLWHSETTSDVAELRNSAVAQQFGVFNTYNSSTSYERAVMDWQTTANLFRFGTEKGSGGGTARDLALVTDATVRLTINAAGNIIPVLPTSAAGLPSGALWNNSGVVNVA